MTSSYELDPNAGQYTWNLDFTDEGKTQGIVMSQSRMRDIELVVNPLGSIDTLNSVGMMSFGTGSWVDLLVSTTLVFLFYFLTSLLLSSTPTRLYPPKGTRHYMSVISRMRAALKIKLHKH